MCKARLVGCVVRVTNSDREDKNKTKGEEKNKLTNKEMEIMELFTGVCLLLVNGCCVLCHDRNEHQLTRSLLVC